MYTHNERDIMYRRRNSGEGYAYYEGNAGQAHRVRVYKGWQKELIELLDMASPPLSSILFFPNSPSDDLDAIEVSSDDITISVDDTVDGRLIRMLSAFSSKHQLIFFIEAKQDYAEQWDNELADRVYQQIYFRG